MKLKKKDPELSKAAYMIETILLNSLTGMPTKRNETIDLSDGYISYNPSTDTGEETAIVKSGKFFILLGDFRKELADCKNTAECVKIYKKLIKNGAKVSLWSNYEYS